MESAVFSVLLLVGLAAAAPTSKENEKLEITKNFFPESFAVYSSQYDIVDLVVPLNDLNFNEDDDTSESESGESGSAGYIFFTEAEITDGHVDYKGVFSLTGKRVTKLLQGGRATATDSGDNSIAYIAAVDGIYRYDYKKQETTKYGTLTDRLIAIAKVNSSDTIYVINEDKQLLKVTENGEKHVRVSDVPAAEQIVLDLQDNLYYIGTDKQVYVINANGSIKIEGIPVSSTYIKLLKAPFVIDDAIPLIVDESTYYIYPNGTSEVADYIIKEKPTAYGMEAAIIQYFGYNKKIYEYNVLSMLLGTVLDELKDFLNDKKDTIQDLATRSRAQA